MPLFYLLLLVSILFSLPSLAIAEETLQMMINQAVSGQTITLKDGTYEGPIVIKKPITIIGNPNVIIESTIDQPLISIHSNDVSISHVKMNQKGSVHTPAFFIQGNQNKLSHIQIKTNGIGIKLNQSSKNELTQMVIQGPSLSTTQLHQGNAIELWNSNQNQISDVKIHGMHDGIYLERSNENQIIHNWIDQSRYGIHLMYADHTKIIANELLQNVTGAMIMVAKHTQLARNHFIKSQQHVYSQGLLLFQTFHTVVEENVFLDNRIGSYIESSMNNKFLHNQWKKNGMGIQLKTSEQNQFYENDFIANVIHAQAIDSLHNHVEDNYWDDQEAVDCSGDGKSDLAYPIDPYFLTITETYPEFQLLFQSPGMGLLKQLFKTNESILLQDQAPSMMANLPSKPEGFHSPFSSWFAVVLLLSGSCLIYIQGRK